MIHYINKDLLFDDCIFSLGYYLILQADGEISDMLPSYMHNVVDTESNSNSKITEAFEKKWQTLYEMAQNNISDINELVGIIDGLNTFSIGDISKILVVHGAKKIGIHNLGDLLSINIQDIPMRGRWALKSFNNFFDYWVGSFPSSVRTSN